MGETVIDRSIRIYTEVVNNRKRQILVAEKTLNELKASLKAAEYMLQCAHNVN